MEKEIQDFVLMVEAHRMQEAQFIERLRKMETKKPTKSQEKKAAIASQVITNRNRHLLKTYNKK